MVFQYSWSHNEANFGPPVEKQIGGGMHISVEIVLQYQGRFIGLRRESIPGHEAPEHAYKHPHGLLYFCHDLIRYGESIKECVERIVKSQTGTNVTSYRLIDIESTIQDKDNQWAFTPTIVARLESKPVIGTFGNQIHEVVEFTKADIPDDFAWWAKEELRELLSRIDDQSNEC